MESIFDKKKYILNMKFIDHDLSCNVGGLLPLFPKN
jgi:hypothetical protein